MGGIPDGLVGDEAGTQIVLSGIDGRRFPAMTWVEQATRACFDRRSLELAGPPAAVGRLVEEPILHSPRVLDDERADLVVDGDDPLSFAGLIDLKMKSSGEATDKYI